LPPVWKHAHKVPILKPGKDPTQPSSYRPISLLDIVGNLFEKILLSRVLRAVNERGLLGDEQFGFRPKHSTTLQLAHLVERVNRNFDERRLTSAVFLDVAKAFDTVWVKGLLSKITLYNFPPDLVKPVSSYLACRKLQTSFQSATTTCVMRARVAQGRLLSPVLFSLYVKEISTRSRHIELAQYAEYTALVVTSSDPSVIVGYLEAYLGRLELCFRNWRIGTNVSKSTAVFFAKAGTRVREPRPVQFLGVPIQWVQWAPRLGVTLDTWLTWSAHLNQVR
jgi:hypothetical protein